MLAPVAGLVNLIAWPRDVLAYGTGDVTRAMVMTYLYSLIPVLLGSITLVRDIVKERAILSRERMIGLLPGAYVASRLSVAMLLAVYHSAVLFAMLALWVRFPGFGAADYSGLYVTLLLSLFGGDRGRTARLGAGAARGAGAGADRRRRARRDCVLRDPRRFRPGADRPGGR